MQVLDRKLFARGKGMQARFGVLDGRRGAERRIQRGGTFFGERHKSADVVDVLVRDENAVEVVEREVQHRERLCGGGALNGALAQCIRECAGDTIYVRSTSALGVDPMHVEAMAFAWLAWAFLQKKPGNLPEVTNASGARLLGALYPH